MIAAGQVVTAKPPPKGAPVTVLNRKALSWDDATPVQSSRSGPSYRTMCEPFQLGECIVDPLTGSIRRRDRTVNIVEAGVMQLLLQLARSPGELITRRALIDAIWYPGANCNAALTRAMSRLRCALGDTSRPPRYVQTVRGHGYRLLFEPVPCGSVRFDTLSLQHDSSPMSPESGPGMSDFARFLCELRRRRVFRVASAYLFTGWLVVQVGETVFDPLGIPAWCLTALVVIVMLGFPMAVAMAWVVQLTCDGAVLETSANTQRRLRKRARVKPRRRLLLGATMLLVMSLGLSFGVAVMAMEHTVTANASESPR